MAGKKISQLLWGTEKYTGSDTLPVHYWNGLKRDQKKAKTIDNIY